MWTCLSQKHYFRQALATLAGTNHFLNKVKLNYYQEAINFPVPSKLRNRGENKYLLHFFVDKQKLDAFIIDFLDRLQPLKYSLK